MIEAQTKESIVRQRSATGAKERAHKLCCAVDYNTEYLKVIPQEVIERDYGCGDPSRYLREGETVLDLGSGGGKICFIAAQIVGPRGRVIGVDFNEDMLALARKYERQVGAALGYYNVSFRKGRIQDLKLDYDLLAAWLANHPVTDSDSFLALQSQISNLQSRKPMIADESVDVVVSNCVLNLVKHADKPQLFREIHRVLKRG